MSEQTKPPKRKLVLILLPILVLAGAAAIVWWLHISAVRVSTDDAFVDGHIHMIAFKVPGTVKAVLAEHNQQMKQGDPLVELDPTDYEVAVERASAELERDRNLLKELEHAVLVARAQEQQANASVESASANVALQTATREQADTDFRRADKLWSGGAMPRDQYDRVITAQRVAVEQVTVAGSRLAEARAAHEAQKALVIRAELAIPTQQAMVRLRDAALKAAQLNVDYCTLRAPADGRVTRRNVETGNQVQAGQPLMAVVPLDPDRIWITANYKETQLTRVRVGQTVRIRVDAYPDRRLSGRVESIMAGSGSVFSLFPPENATGNYVKVVQRVPVRILIDEDSQPDQPLRLGMSVAPTILTCP